MEITRVKIGLSNGDRIKAYASITLDDCFMIHGFRLTPAQKKAIFFLCRKESTPTARNMDIAMPLNNETRRMIEEKVFAAYQKISDEPVARRVPK